jgi:membrane fusion protein, copper/silver efflux system
MTRAVFTSATVAALIAAAGGGFIAGRSQRQPAGTSVTAVMTPAAAQDAGAPIY